MGSSSNWDGSNSREAAAVAYMCYHHFHEFTKPDLLLEIEKAARDLSYIQSEAAVEHPVWSWSMFDSLAAQIEAHISLVCFQGPTKILLSKFLLVNKLASCRPNNGADYI